MTITSHLLTETQVASNRSRLQAKLQWDPCTQILCALEQVFLQENFLQVGFGGQGQWLMGGFYATSEMGK